MFSDLRLNSEKIFACAFLLLLISLPSFSAASDSVRVGGIRHFSSSDYTRIVVDLTGPVEFSKSRLSNPDRLYFDLKNASIDGEVRTVLPVGDGIVKRIRASQFDPHTVRVVFDIEEISDCKYFVLDSPSRLVIDLYGKSGKPDMAVTKRRIVIDPGHGGHDPGAIGPDRLYEKDVVLDIALKLGKILESDPLNEVYFTRDRDVFVPLEERTAMANRKNADLFVSIHANACSNGQAKGIETYLLNWTDDEEAIRVAARENQISLKKMKAMNRRTDTVDTILSGLMRENKRDKSVRLANYIQKSLVSDLDRNYSDVTDLGVKQALFYVLFGAKMPSVLVEVSFISNREEEKRLSQDSYRMEIAEAIAKGLDRYVNSAPVLQKVAEVVSNKHSFR